MFIAFYDKNFYQRGGSSLFGHCKQNTRKFQLENVINEVLKIKESFP